MAHRSSLKSARRFSYSRYSIFAFTAFLVLLFLIYVGSDDEMLLRAQSSFRLRQTVNSVSPDALQITAPAGLNKETTPAQMLPESNITESIQTNTSYEVTPAPEVGKVEVAPPNSKSQDQKCAGRRIFIYKLPTEFNELIGKECGNWTFGYWSMCDDVINDGFGMPMNLSASDPELAAPLQPPSAWYKTDQFSLEVIFHRRLKDYQCLTEDPAQASVFYVPFYHALDLTRNLYNEVLVRDVLTERFVPWLRNQRSYQLHQGHRHVLVLGRIIWDFIRSGPSTWGSSLLAHPELSNVTKVLIERCAWKDDTVAIPYPTNFHPSSEAQLQLWQTTVRSTSRTQFVSFAGSSRSRNMTTMVRGALFHQCAKSPKCKHLICTHKLCAENSQTIYKLSLESVFCLQPAGDSPTRKGIFDALLSGCIPVLFDEDQAVKQYLWHLPGNGSSYSVLMNRTAVIYDHYDVMHHLERIPKAEIKRMQENVVQLLPKLLYRNPTLDGEYKSRDAFDIAIDSIFDKFDLEHFRGQ